MEKPERYPKISVLFCALDEEQNLPNVLPLLPAWVDEVLLVDGHSTDSTVEIARKLCPNIRVLYQPGRGKGDALKFGIEKASGEIIVTLDADGSTDPAEIMSFIEPLLEGYDFAKGSRFGKVFPKNKPWHRIIGNWIITLTFDLLFFRTYTDLCSGYNAFWKSTMAKVAPWPADGFENEPLINCRVARKGLKVIEVAHQDPGRIRGEVKERSWRQGIKAVKSILRERFSKR